MSSYKLTVPYTPVPKKSVRSGRGGHYNPSRNGMDKVKGYLRQILPKDLPPLTGPLLEIIHHRLPISRSINPKIRAAREGFPHAQRPDGDNLEKFINDCCSGLLWKDDSQIAWTLRSKSQTAEKEGSTTITVIEIPYRAPDYISLLLTLRSHIMIEDQPIDFIQEHHHND